METLETLPVELSFCILEVLDAVSLANYGAVNRQVARWCEYQSFWRNKVRLMPRRELQDQWVVELVKNGEERLLSHLLDAIAREQAEQMSKATTVQCNTAFYDLLDDNARRTAYMHLYAENRQSRLLGVLDECTDNSQTELIIHKVERVKEAWKQRDYSKTILPESYDFTASRFIAGRLESILKILPSPSQFLSLIISFNHDRQTIESIVNIINHWLIPYLISKRQIEPLITYRNDINRLAAYLDKRTIPSGLRDRFDRCALENAPLWLANLLIDNDWEYVTRDYDFSHLQPLFYCRYRSTFLEVVKNSRNDSRRLSLGYSSMEPSEWILWFEGLPEGTNKTEILQETLEYAGNDDYSYFVHRIRAYGKNRGYLR